MHVEGESIYVQDSAGECPIVTQSSSPQQFLVPATSLCHVVCSFHKQHSTRATSTTRNTRSTEQHFPTSRLWVFSTVARRPLRLILRLLLALIMRKKLASLDTKNLG